LVQFQFQSLFTVGEGTGGTVENVDSLVDLLRLGETAPHTGGQAMETVSGLGLEFVREFHL
jgi:hypothetical protein